KSAAAITPQIGTLAISPAISAAHRSAAQVMRAVSTEGQTSSDALVAAINEAFAAEAEFRDPRGGSALTGDIASLAGRDPSCLPDAPLWLNRPPTWAEPRWRDLKAALLNAQQKWQVWTVWYDDRLDGKVNSPAGEAAYVDVPDEFWRRDAI